jgi:uncharacterized protein (TIGR04222 family)
MNPFDLRGPDFLLFYIILSAVLLTALALFRRSRESGPLPSLQLEDPYLFACLKDGPKGVLRACTVSLVDRGFLQVSQGTVSHSAAPPAGTSGQTKVEKEVVGHFRVPQRFDKVFSDTFTVDAAKEYEKTLRSHNLIPDGACFRARLKGLAAVIAALLLAAGIKIAIAISRGHSNVEFLIVLVVFAVVIAFKVGNPYRTSRGSAYLRSVRNLFTDLKGRAASVRPGGETKELLWLTALFGMSALPASAFPFIREFPTPSSSSSSCSSCGGGGCGGGDGGGGCGGCGGHY